MDRSYQPSNKTATCDSTCGIKRLSPRVEKKAETTNTVRRLSPRVQQPSKVVQSTFVVERKITPKVVTITRINPVVRQW